MIFYVPIISFLIPIAIYFICFKKTVLNIPIYLIFLLWSVIDTVFGYHIDFKVKVNIIEELIQFTKGDGMIAFWLMWIPGIIGFILANVCGIIWRKKREKNSC